MIQCPTCNGSGDGGPCLVDLSSIGGGSFREETVCCDCDGTGFVTDEHAALMARGIVARRRRMELEYTLRRAAELMRLSPTEVSRMEQGLADPTRLETWLKERGRGERG